MIIYNQSLKLICTTSELHLKSKIVSNILLELHRFPMPFPYNKRNLPKYYRLYERTLKYCLRFEGVFSYNITLRNRYKQ